MANLQKCKRCGADLSVGPLATNQRFCGPDCRDTWWNENRNKGRTQSQVAEARLGRARTFTLTDVQAAWLAALVDGEGTIGVWRERRPGNTSGFRYKAVVQIGNTNRDILLQVERLVDGTAYVDRNAHNRNPKHKLFFRVTVRPRAVRRLLEQIKGYLIIKVRQADLVIAFCDVMAGAPMRASQDHGIFEQFYRDCKTLNRKGVQCQ